MSHRPFQLRARSWLQLAFLPSIALVILAVGATLVRDLRHLILEEFDRELEVVGRVQAAFLDEAEHAWLMEEPDFVALAAGGPAGDFWAVLNVNGEQELALVDRNSGELGQERVSLSQPVVDVAYTSEWGLVGVSLSAPNRLYRINPADGSVSPWRDLGAPITALASDPDGNRLWGAGHGKAFGWEGPDSAGREVEAEWPESVSELVFDATANVLWAESGSDREWHGLQLSDRSNVAGAVWDSFHIFPRALAFDADRGLVVGAAERLLGVDLARGAVVTDDYTIAFGKVHSAYYQRAVRPFQRTLDRLGLTYLYSQSVSDGSLIVYGLDGSVDDDHSPLYTRDVLPSGEVEGVARLIETGDLHFTELSRWENWGFLKSVFVPIGTGNMMVGVDVNVGVIEHRTRQALVTVFGLVAVSLMLTSAWSLRISKTLRAPIERLKAGALKLAVGDAEELAVLRPRELGRLALALNEVGRLMRERSSDLRRRLDDESTLQYERRITGVIDAEWSAFFPARDISVLSPEPGLRLDASTFAIGWGSTADEPPSESLERSVLLEQFRAKVPPRGSAAAAFESWRGLAAFAIVDQVRRTVWLYRRPGAESGFGRRTNKPAGDQLQLGDGPKIDLADFQFKEVAP